MHQPHGAQVRTAAQLAAVVVDGQLAGAPARPADDLPRTCEGNLNGHLLIKNYPHEQGKRVLGERLVRFGIASQTQLLGHRFVVPRQGRRGIYLQRCRDLLITSVS